MICPKCGSNYVTSQAITETETIENIKGFGCIKACIGFLLFNIPGILCGFCGMGRGKARTIARTKVVNICQNCGKHF